MNQQPPSLLSGLADRYPDVSALDFAFVPMGGAFALRFDDSLGYAPRFNYAPELAYLPSRALWRVTSGPVRLLTHENPALELAFELRGYLLGLPERPDPALILDVGPGKSGLFGLFCAARHPASKVALVEADPRAAERVAENLRANRLENIGLVNAALAESDGRARFILDADIDASRLDPEGETEVDTRSLSSLLDELAPETTARIFVKLDIEGAEALLVNDMAAALDERPGLTLAVASYHPVEGVESAEIIQEAVGGRGHIFARTLFPGHKTTFLCHARNLAVKSLLSKYEAA